MALMFAGNARFASLRRKRFHEKQAMFSSGWWIIQRGSLETSCVLTLPNLFLILKSKQQFSWSWAMKTFFLRPAIQRKNATARAWRWEMWFRMMSCLFSRFLQVNLGHFISQVFISALGNHYMFSIWKKMSILAFHGICAVFKPLCNFMQTKAFQVTRSVWVIGVH